MRYKSLFLQNKEVIKLMSMFIRGFCAGQRWRPGRHGGINIGGPKPHYAPLRLGGDGERG